MKKKIALLTILLWILAAMPASAQVLYDDGPINGSITGWVINFGFIVSDTFTLSANSTVGGVDFGTWEFPGDVLSSVEWSVTTAENGGTILGSGTASGRNLTDTFISTNQYGYDIDKITVTGLNLGLNGGTYWLNLMNAAVPSGDPVFWDMNNGQDCGGDDGKGGGCPSMASASTIGTIYAEAFTMIGEGTGTTPEPGSFLLFASGVLGLAGALRRKLF